jgi:hypothetical protein
MRRSLIAAAAFVIAAGIISSAQAVWIDQSVHYVRRGYHRNVDWPWPYICPDRVAVREPFCIMERNGWRRQNLLGPHHFNANSNQLTSAGELKVRWIMTQAPPERRGIFVERSLEPDITANRLATARAYAAQVAQAANDTQTPQVFEVNLISEGRPAAVVDATNVRFQESTPPPVLPPLILGAGAGQ